MPPITWKQPVVFDVIEPNGRFLGTVAIPGVRKSPYDSFPRIVRARDMTVWTIELGEFDEQYVVRYRIVPGN
jgi:hypothetical protein